MVELSPRGQNEAIEIDTSPVGDTARFLQETLAGMYDNNSKYIFSKVWVSDMLSPPEDNEVAAIVYPYDKEKNEVYAGLNAPIGPYQVPFYISIYMPGDPNTISPILHDLEDLVETEIMKDRTMDGNCEGCYFPDPYVFYGSGEWVKTNAILNGVLIIVICEYTGL